MRQKECKHSFLEPGRAGAKVRSPEKQRKSEPLGRKGGCGWNTGAPMRITSQWTWQSTLGVEFDVGCWELGKDTQIFPKANQETGLCSNTPERIQKKNKNL